MKLPELRLNKAPVEQRERLRRWLTEWEVDSELPGPPPVPSAAESREAGNAPVAAWLADDSPRMGQVRLLVPSPGRADRRPVYVAVISEISGSFLVAPFGRFSEPCLPGELCTDIDSPALRVLCVWNAVRIASALLARSWHASDMPNELLRDTSALHDALEEGKPVPGHLMSRVGPPSWHPADPRRLYEAEESVLSQAIARGDGSATFSYPTDSSPWLLAADPGSEYGSEPGAPPDNGKFPPDPPSESTS